MFAVPYEPELPAFPFDAAVARPVVEHVTSSHPAYTNVPLATGQVTFTPDGAALKPVTHEMAPSAVTLVLFARPATE